MSFHNSMCQQAIQRFLSPPRLLPACRARRLPPGNRPRCLPQASWLKIPCLCVSHLPVGASIEASATKSLGVPVFSLQARRLRLSSPPASSFVSAASVRSILVLSPVSEVGSVLLNFFVHINNCRIWDLASETSLPGHRRPTLSPDQPSRYSTRVESRMTLVPL